MDRLALRAAALSILGAIAMVSMARAQTTGKNLPAFNVNIYLGVRKTIVNALPDVVICGEAATHIRADQVRPWMSGERRTVDSIRILAKCPKKLDDGIRRRDLVTVFISDLSRATAGTIVATACQDGCGRSRVEEWTAANMSIRFTAWAVGD